MYYIYMRREREGIRVYIAIPSVNRGLMYSNNYYPNGYHQYSLRQLIGTERECRIIIMVSRVLDLSAHRFGSQVLHVDLIYILLYTSIKGRYTHTPMLTSQQLMVDTIISIIPYYGQSKEHQAFLLQDAHGLLHSAHYKYLCISLQAPQLGSYIGYP